LSFKLKEYEKKLFLVGNIANAQLLSPDQQLIQDYTKTLKNKNTRPAEITTDIAGGDIVWIDEFEDATEWISDGSGVDADHGWQISESTENWFFPAGDMGITGGFAKFINDDPNDGTVTNDCPLTLTFDSVIDLSSVPLLI